MLTALTLESEEFKVKKRKVDKDARALASTGKSRSSLQPRRLVAAAMKGRLQG